MDYDSPVRFGRALEEKCRQETLIQPRPENASAQTPLLVRSRFAESESKTDDKQRKVLGGEKPCSFPLPLLDLESHKILALSDDSFLNVL